MTPNQLFIIALMKEIGDLLSKNSAVILGLLSAFGVGLHLKQPWYMNKGTPNDNASVPGPK